MSFLLSLQKRKRFSQENKLRNDPAHIELCISDFMEQLNQKELATLHNLKPTEVLTDADNITPRPPPEGTENSYQNQDRYRQRIMAHNNSNTVVYTLLKSMLGDNYDSDVRYVDSNVTLTTVKQRVYALIDILNSKTQASIHVINLKLSNDLNRIGKQRTFQSCLDTLSIFNYFNELYLMYNKVEYPFNTLIVTYISTLSDETTDNANTLREQIFNKKGINNWKEFNTYFSDFLIQRTSLSSSSKTSEPIIQPTPSSVEQLAISNINNSYTHPNNVYPPPPFINQYTGQAMNQSNNNQQYGNRNGNGGKSSASFQHSQNRSRPYEPTHQFPPNSNNRSNNNNNRYNGNNGYNNRNNGNNNNNNNYNNRNNGNNNHNNGNNNKNNNNNNNGGYNNKNNNNNNSNNGNNGNNNHNNRNNGNNGNNNRNTLASNFQISNNNSQAQSNFDQQLFQNIMQAAINTSQIHNSINDDDFDDNNDDNNNNDNNNDNNNNNNNDNYNGNDNNNNNNDQSFSINHSSFNVNQDQEEQD
jgi:hypothetical protein